MISFVNTTTNEIEYKIFDREGQAHYGQITTLKVSRNLLAVGYSSGTVQIFDLDLSNCI